MKTMLAILLSFIVSEAPVLAIHGGYTLGGQAGVTGTYAGVMIPSAPVDYLGGTTDTSGTLTTPVSSFGVNSIGIFTLSVPTVGLGNGTVYIFSTSQSMSGGITCLPDPSNNGGIYGTIIATGSVASETYTDALFDVNYSYSQVTGQGVGTLYVNTSTSLNSISASGINLTGSADITFSSSSTTDTADFVPYEEIQYYVDGFQQSAAATSGT